MMQNTAGNFKHLSPLLFSYMESKAKLWEVCLCESQSISIYYETLENYKDFLIELISSLDYVQRTHCLTQHQRVASENVTHQLLEDNNVIKDFTQTYFQNFKGKPLTSKERKWKKEMLNYCDDLPDEPDMVSKRFFTNGAPKEEITFKSPFSIDDGENVHQFQPTAKIKILPKQQ